MSKVLNTLSAIGALVMAATPLVAVGDVAHAAEPGVKPAHIWVSDLNLATRRPSASAWTRPRRASAPSPARWTSTS